MKFLLMFFILISGYNLYTSYNHYNYYKDLESKWNEVFSVREKSMTFSKILKSDHFQDFFQKSPKFEAMIKSSSDLEEKLCHNIMAIISKGTRECALALFLDFLIFIGFSLLFILLNRKGKSVL